jgi:hypothetical protein
MTREVSKNMTNTEVQNLWNMEKLKEAEARGETVDDTNLRVSISKCVAEAGPVRRHAEETTP